MVTIDVWITGFDSHELKEYMQKRADAKYGKKYWYGQLVIRFVRPGDVTFEIVENAPGMYDDDDEILHVTVERGLPYSYMMSYMFYVVERKILDHRNGITKIGYIYDDADEYVFGRIETLMAHIGIPYNIWITPMRNPDKNVFQDLYIYDSNHIKRECEGIDIASFTLGRFNYEIETALKKLERTGPPRSYYRGVSLPDRDIVGFYLNRISRVDCNLINGFLDKFWDERLVVINPMEGIKLAFIDKNMKIHVVSDDMKYYMIDNEMDGPECLRQLIDFNRKIV